MLFSLVNQAYLNLTLNWLCDVYALEKNHPNEQIHNSLLLVSLDEAVCKRVVKDWKSVSCLWLKEGIDKARHNRDAEGNRRLFRQIANVRINLMAALAEVSAYNNSCNIFSHLF